MVFLWVFGIIVVVLFLLCLLLYNSIVRLRNAVDNSWSGVDVQLKRRADLIPNLVKVVGGYVKHEKKVLEDVTIARTAILDSRGNVTKAAAAEDVLKEALVKLFAVSENYPKLKASDNFLLLQNELARTEDEIASARRIYNDNVREYNTKIEVFPNNFLRMLFYFKKADYFRASLKDKEKIKVDF